MKYRVLVLSVLFFSLCLTSCGKKEDELWSPAIDGINWGMSIDEVISVLGQDNVSTEENTNGTDVRTLTKIKTSFGIDMVAVLHFNDTNSVLVNLYFECADDYSEIKAILEEKYKDCDTDYGTNNITWQSETVNELANYGVIIQKYKEYVENNNFDGDEQELEKSFSSLSVYHVNLHDVGILSMFGSTKVSIDMLLDE